MMRLVKRLLKFAAALIIIAIVFVATLVLLNFRTPAETDLAKSQQLREPPSPIAQPVTLKLVTFNIWGLPVIVDNDPRAARMRAVGQALAALEPDIVALQESFRKKDRTVVARELESAGLVHHHYYRSALVGSGLSVFSRYPIAEAFFHRYTEGGKAHKIWHGDWWAGKGVSVARIELPDGGFVDLFNTHVHAGYGADEYEDVQASQVNELVDFVQRAATQTSPAFLLGDMNVKAGERQYETLVTDAKLERLMTLPSRIDHIFAPANARYTYEVLDTVAINQPFMLDGEEVALSDHTGYMSTIRVGPVTPAE